MATNNNNNDIDIDIDNCDEWAFIIECIKVCLNLVDDGCARTQLERKLETVTDIYVRKFGTSRLASREETRRRYVRGHPYNQILMITEQIHGWKRNTTIQ